MNGQDPLAQLRDIHVPEPLGWWPLAPGWWILALLLLAAIITGCWLLYRRWMNGAYRRLAHRELASAWETLQQEGDRQAYGHQVNQILRRAARMAYSPHLVNPLHGEAWLAFLDKTGNGSTAPNAFSRTFSHGPGRDRRLMRSGFDSRPFSHGPGRDLLVLPYRPISEEKDLAPLHHLATRWLTTHRQFNADTTREARRAAV